MATTRNAQLSGDASRERILGIALRLFGTRGYRGTSLATVAKEAGLSQAGLLHHFPSKSALLAAVLDERDRRDLEFVHAPQDLAKVGLAMILENIEAFVEHNLGNRAQIQLAHMVALEAGELDSTAGSWARDRLARTRGTLVAATRKSLEHAEIRLDANPQVVAGLIIAAFEGLENQWLIDPSFDMVGGMRAFAAALRADLQMAPAPAGAAVRT